MNFLSPRSFALSLAVVGPASRVWDTLELIGREAKIDGAVLDVNPGGEMIFAAADLLTERGVPFVFTRL
jgi:hypothetical protein